MGGRAFSIGDDPLYTPRMPPAIYEYVLNSCSAKLRGLFVVVATPIPGPAKKDYGDIDIFLAWERDSIFPSTTSADIIEPPSSSHSPLDSAAHILNAKRAIQEQKSVRSIAIPWPEELPEEITSNYGEDSEGATKARYIQVDLHHCKSLKHQSECPQHHRESLEHYCDCPEHHCESLEKLQWMLFKYAHGDIWSILGSIIRPFDLTLDEMAMHLRIPEIESRLGRKKAKILLTKDPKEILDFLGLKQDGKQWEEPFASVEDLFEYATTCRLFWIRPPQPDEENAEKAEGGETVKSKLRRDMKQRPVFRIWVDEFVPACQQAGRFVTQTATRDSVRAEASERFPSMQQAYEAKLLDCRKEQQRQTNWKDVIKAAMPETEGRDPSDQHWRSHTAAALKKIIMRDDYSLGVYPVAPLRDSNGLYDEEKVRQFVVDNWEQVGQLAWKENQARYAEKLAAKQGTRCEGDADGKPSDNTMTPEESTRPAE
ncbi:hypothetical protein F4821DRAFT_143383 [Hypoxylon rubiginosum]|uniref:Uncharacterized protein n=1 Tax=Hypoxylon rubiginosum TaxID=110542 RepID=A0ACC0CZH3_9PEZI|nr:hypothetical protein F4821DRAFT_143383 [Hypoxylon rubiginosum]